MDLGVHVYCNSIFQIYKETSQKLQICKRQINVSAGALKWVNTNRLQIVHPGSHYRLPLYNTGTCIPQHPH